MLDIISKRLEVSALEAKLKEAKLELEVLVAQCDHKYPDGQSAIKVEDAWLMDITYCDVCNRGV